MMDSGEDLLRQKMSDLETLRQAVEDIKAGEKERAKQLLIEILQRDEDNENAWLWMTRCVDDRETKRECFEHVLTINPHNEHAIKGLERLDNPASAPRRRTKTAKNQGRLVMGIAAAALVMAIILVVLWWALDNKSEQPEQAVTAAVLITHGHQALADFCNGRIPVNFLETAIRASPHGRGNPVLAILVVIEAGGFLAEVAL